MLPDDGRGAPGLGQHRQADAPDELREIRRQTDQAHVLGGPEDRLVEDRVGLGRGLEVAALDRSCLTVEEARQVGGKLLVEAPRGESRGERLEGRADRVDLVDLARGRRDDGDAVPWQCSNEPLLFKPAERFAERAARYAQL